MASDTEFDFIIVGGGTAGCALASRLHQRLPTKTIALLERGPDARTHPYVTNPLAAPLLSTTDLVSDYTTLPQRGLAHRRIPNYAGNMLSGSSGINYGAWLRPHGADYDAWAAAAGGGPDAARWSAAGMLPWLKAVERHHDPGADRAVHGFEGPVRTSESARFLLGERARKAFEKVGFGKVEDVNGGEAFGCARWNWNWHEGLRQPAGTVYELEGVRTVVGAGVDRIVLGREGDGGVVRARGVELTDGGRMTARHEVVVCCGANKTPQLLMLSGIGPAEELQRHGIEMVVESPQVGKNHWDHLALHQAWRLRDEARRQGLAAGHVLFNKPEHVGGVPVEWMGTGTVPAEGLAEAVRADAGGGQVNGSHAEAAGPRAHYQIMMAYMPLSLGPGHDIAVDGSCISTGVLLYHPTSRGTVTLASADPRAPPVKDPCYFTTAADRHILRVGLRRAMELIETEEMQAVVQEEVPPEGYGPLCSRSSDAEIERRVEGLATVWHHAAGTAAMGTVVDALLKVKGVQGLRIADASVFPKPISATLQASVYALAEQAASIIAEAHV